MSYRGDIMAANARGDYGAALSMPFKKFGGWLGEQFGGLTPQEKRDIAAGGSKFDNRGIPEFAPGDLAANTSLRNTLQGRVAGTAPSPAELQMRAGLDRQLAGINAAAASGSGASNPGLALRQALFAGQNAGSAFNQDSGILRAQEQAAAEGRLASLLGMNQGTALNSRGQNDARSVNAQAVALQMANQAAQARAALTGTVLNVAGGLVAGPVGSGISSALKGGGGTGLPAGYEPMAANGGPSAGQVYAAPNQTVPWAQNYTPPAEQATWLGYSGGAGMQLTPPTYPTNMKLGLPNSKFTFADGGFLTQPTQILAGEAGPEAVVPLTSPQDAALAAQMIERARQKKAAAVLIQSLNLGGAQAGAR